MSQVRDRIEKAIDAFETDVRQGPTDDNYYYRLMAEIEEAVAEWIEGHTGDSWGEGEMFAEQWREAMKRHAPASGSSSSTLLPRSQRERASSGLLSQPS